MPCNNKVMGLLITIKAMYHVPFKMNTIRGIGSNECFRYHIEWTGRWEKVNALRKDMKDRGVSKVPGCSWIDVGERKHVFGAGDKSHSDICKIETFLEDIYDVVKDDAIVNHDIMEHASHVCI
ncbi:hypothetical protein F2Q68_00019052 [Brassica cretica]|uniref:Pentatricopeptide repeat-containing protein n=1 Tax=Brassica cretica TaxID=69181 RepID=A0A8S9FZ51_BRACR|nr:hypothetical protein F2Q68_00019052 [Brassica cretica]